MSWDSHPLTEGDDEQGEASRIEVLRTLRRESREVLSKRIEKLSSIDDKAMRSVRTSIIVIGLVVSASQLTLNNESATFGPTARWLVSTGVVSLFLSILFGVFTYSVSEPEFGVSSDHRDEVRSESYDEREWLDYHLSEYDEWIENMEGTNEWNTIFLHTTLVTMILGVLLLLLAAASSTGFSIDCDSGLRTACSSVLAPILFTGFVLGGLLFWSRKR